MYNRYDRSTKIIGGFLKTIRELGDENLRLKKWLNVAIIIACLTVTYEFMWCWDLEALEDLKIDSGQFEYHVSFFKNHCSVVCGC